MVRFITVTFEIETDTDEVQLAEDFYGVLGEHQWGDSFPPERPAQLHSYTIERIT